MQVAAGSRMVSRHIKTGISILARQMTSMATKPNIGLYTDEHHKLKVAPCLPATDSLNCGPDDCLVHIRSTGICATDVHFWKEGHLGDNLQVKTPQILGHESAGEVIAVGENVKNLKAGDRVAIEPGVQCLKCDMCTSGKYRACKNIQFKSLAPVPGLLRRYLTHPARLCHPIGDMSYEMGALLEPISVGLMGIHESGLRLGDATLICGAGPIGLASAILARAAGAAPLVITDLVQDRLDLAKKMVPGILTVLIDRAASPQTTAAQIVEIAGLRPSVCIECTGFEQSISTAIYAMEFGSTIEVLGLGSDQLTLPFMHASVNEVTIRSSFCYNNTWPRAIRLVQNGLIDPSPLVTHRFKLEDAVAAFEKFIEPGSGAVKVQIQDDAI